MHPSHYLEPFFPTSELDGFGSLPPLTTYLYLPVELPAQYTAWCEPTGIPPVQHSWNSLPVEHSVPLVHDTPNQGGAFGGPQLANLSYAEGATQTIRLEYANEGEITAEQDQVQASRRPTLHPVPQVPYRSTRHQAAPSTIEFTVDGKRGIRLSDVLEENWVGFEGRDDRSLFEGNRLQIILRLNFVGCSPWQSKVHVMDFTSKRRPISRARLATEVARCMRKFIAREKLNGHATGRPRCDWGDVSLKNVFLTRIVRVSVASWQPEICVEQPLVPSQAAASSFSSDPHV